MHCPLERKYFVMAKSRSFLGDFISDYLVRKNKIIFIQEVYGYGIPKITQHGGHKHPSKLKEFGFICRRTPLLHISSIVFVSVCIVMNKISYSITNLRKDSSGFL